MAQVEIPAVYMRGGSSKGVIFHSRDLPASREARDRLFLAALGSPDPFGRQLDGMGGGISSLSKAAVIGPPTHPDADVDYTFAQVAVDRPVVDYGANCGNLSSAVGPFAVDEGLVAVSDGDFVDPAGSVARGQAAGIHASPTADVRVGNPSGCLPVAAAVTPDGAGGWCVTHSAAYRTARRLMGGRAYARLEEP